MTKRPGSGTGRFGEGAQGAPLPMVTQAIGPIDDPSATRIENPLARLVDPALAGIRPEALGPAVFGKPTAMSSPQPKSLSPVGPPPEVGLTQHALPTDEKPDPRLVLMLDPDSERAASFRVLRHHLLELGRPQVIVVSSAQAGDGKTTTALNLALALAECGRAKVLLAEAHMRRPQLANIFKCIPPWCFAEQLAAHRHQPMLPWSFVEIPQVWLHVAPVSPRIEKTQLLDGPALSIAMERLRLAGYDHIVIDAPSVLGSADVNLMADAADAVLLSVRARRSTSRDLRKAIDQIGARKVVGTVIVE